MRQRPKLVFVLKLVATVFALLVLSKLVSPREMAMRLYHLNRPWFLLGLAAVFSEFAVSAWKTSWMLGHKTQGIGFQLKLNCVKSLFSLLLPGGLGGEAMRFIYITRQMGAPGRAAALIVNERLSGLWAQIIGSAMTALLLPWPNFDLQTRLILIVTLVLLYCFGWPLVPGSFALLIRILPAKWAKSLLGSYAGEHEAFFQALADWSSMSGKRFMLLAFAGLNQIAIIALIYTLAQATLSPIDWRWVSLVMLLASLSSVLPFTMGGLGVVEGGFGLGFHLAGLAADLGVGVSLVLRCIMVIPVGLGAFYFLRGFDPRQAPKTIS